MMSQSLLQNLESDQGKINNLQNQLSSGHRINSPSDDPSGIQNVIQLQNNVASVNQWTSNANSAAQIMSTTDGTLGDMTSILQQVRELAVEGSNGTMTTSDSSTIADEVNQFSDQLKSMANTQVGSTYIFSGTATDQKLIPTDSTSTTQANSNPVTFEVGNEVYIPVSVNGLSVFGDGTTTNGSGGVFDTLSKLSTALKSNDYTTVSNLLGPLDDNINNVIAQRADLGARENRVTAIQNQLSSTSLSLQQSLSNIQDTDMAKSLTDFTNQQNTYQAALSVGAKIIQTSLVDFITS